MIKRRLASMTSALAFLTVPVATMSAMTSPSTTMSRGSPRSVETECTDPPVITSMETVPLAGRVTAMRRAYTACGSHVCFAQAQSAAECRDHQFIISCSQFGRDSKF
jgi:hypothetical protein